MTFRFLTERKMLLYECEYESIMIAVHNLIIELVTNNLVTNSMMTLRCFGPKKRIALNSNSISNDLPCPKKGGFAFTSGFAFLLMTSYPVHSRSFLI
jgi:hypothetical protein